MFILRMEDWRATLGISGEECVRDVTDKLSSTYKRELAQAMV